MVLYEIKENDSTKPSQCFKPKWHFSWQLLANELQTYCAKDQIQYCQICKVFLVCRISGYHISLLIQWTDFPTCHYRLPNASWILVTALSYCSYLIGCCLNAVKVDFQFRVIGVPFTQMNGLCPHCRRVGQPSCRHSGGASSTQPGHGGLLTHWGETAWGLLKIWKHHAFSPWISDLTPPPQKVLVSNNARKGHAPEHRDQHRFLHVEKTFSRQPVFRDTDLQ